MMDISPMITQGLNAVVLVLMVVLVAVVLMVAQALMSAQTIASILMTLVSLVPVLESQRQSVLLDPL
jgi:hypothetical protein